MGFLSSQRRAPEPRTLTGVKCPVCGGRLFVSRA